MNSKAYNNGQATRATINKVANTAKDVTVTTAGAVKGFIAGFLSNPDVPAPTPKRVGRPRSSAK